MTTDRLIVEYLIKDSMSAKLTDLTKKTEAFGNATKKQQQDMLSGSRKTASQFYRTQDAMHGVSNGFLAMGAAGTAYDVTALRAAGNAQKAMKTLQILTRSSAKGKSLFDFANTRDAMSDFNLNELLDGTKMLTAYGMDAFRWLPIAEDMATALNKPLSEAVFTLGQMQSGDWGQVFGLGMGLNNFGISREEIAAAGIKLNTGGGKLYDGDKLDAMNKIEKLIQSKYGGLSSGMSTSTLSGSLSAVESAFIRLNTAVGNSSLPLATETLKKFAGAVNAIATNMPGWLGATIMLAGPLATVIGLVGKGVIFYKAFNEAKKLTGVLSALNAAVHLPAESAALATQGIAVDTATGKWNKLGWAKKAALGVGAAALGVGTAIGIGEGMEWLEKKTGVEKGSWTQQIMNALGSGLQGAAAGAGGGALAGSIGLAPGVGLGALVGGLGGFVYGVGRGIYQNITDPDPEGRKRGEDAERRMKALREAEKRGKGKAWVRQEWGKDGVSPREALLAQQHGVAPSALANALKGKSDSEVNYLLGGGQMGGARLWRGMSAADMQREMAKLADGSWLKGAGGTLWDQLKTKAGDKSALAPLTNITGDPRSVGRPTDFKRYALGGSALAQAGVTPVELAGFRKNGAQGSITIDVRGATNEITKFVEDIAWQTLNKAKRQRAF